MPWGRCDDSFYDHPKVRRMDAAIRNEACGLYWRAISFCNRHLTDGRLTPEDVVFLDGSPASARELVRVGLWDERGGIRVHDYLTFNKSKAQVLRERKAKAKAGQAGGLASGRSRREANTKQSASVLVEHPSRPVPTRPDRGDIGYTTPTGFSDTRPVKVAGSTR
jgi:hypothetical protein